MARSCTEGRLLCAWNTVPKAINVHDEHYNGFIEPVLYTFPFMMHCFGVNQGRKCLQNGYPASAQIR